MFDLNRVRASWQRESDAIDAIVQRLDEEAARRPIRNDGWTAQDILGHIADSARAFVKQLQTNKPLPIGIVIDIDALNEQQRERSQNQPWIDVIGYWTYTRDDIAGFLQAAPDDIGERPAHLPWLPSVTTAGDLLRILIVHTRNHRQELERGIT